MLSGCDMVSPLDRREAAVDQSIDTHERDHAALDSVARSSEDDLVQVTGPAGHRDLVMRIVRRELLFPLCHCGHLGHLETVRKAGDPPFGLHSAGSPQLRT